MKTITSTDKPFQHKERQDTDQSLDDERFKTNRKLKQIRSQYALETERDLERQRETTDEAVVAARSASDSQRDHQRDASSYNGNEVKKTGEDRLRAERQLSDRAVIAERARSDMAIEAERDAKNTAEDQILKDERALTNKHLKAERDSTDAASGQLASEVAEHLKTRATLTTREEFLAIVSHDLRNPIGAVSSCMEMLLEDSESSMLDVDTRYWLQFAKRNADSALRLISDLLDMERIANGKLEFVFRSEDIGVIVRDAAQNSRQAAALKGVLLKTYSPKSKEWVSCDADRITQVLNNIIGNALKFTPEGGRIEIKTFSDENEVKIRISDSGEGIPQHKLGQIFDRFAQLGQKDRRGLGLGLYISKMLIEAHQGQIVAESTPGVGSTFTVTLPRKLRGVTTA